MKSLGLSLAAALCLLFVAQTGFAQEKFFDSNGIRIHYVEQGAGEPILLLHGDGAGNVNEWIDAGVFASLAQNNRVIAFDARGSGKSDKPHDADAYGREMGLDAIRLMDYLGIDKAHIIGYSMGAHITAQLLTTHASRFISVVLGGAAGRFRWQEEDIAVRTVTEPAERERECVSRTQIFRLAPTNAPKPDEEEIQARSAACKANPNIDQFALAARTRAERAYVITPAQLERVELPMLGIVGSLDSYVEDFNELKKLQPGMQLVIIDQANHGTAFQRPEFVTAVREFIASNRAASSQ